MMRNNSKELLKPNKIELSHNYRVYKNTANDSFLSSHKFEVRAFYTCSFSKGHLVSLFSYL